MATMILLPDGSSSVSHWTPAPFPNSPSSALDDDNGDTSYVACSAANRQLNLTYANPSVAEGDIDFSVAPSVRFLSSGRSTHRTTDSEVDISFLTPTAGFLETVSYDKHASSYETINGTARTTSDGSAAWTYSDLENLSMKCTKNGSIQVRLSYLALEVTYTEAVAVTADNATFFGANF